MPSSTSLSDLLTEMRDLDAIDRGEVSERSIAARVFVVAPSFVVPRGYLRDNIDLAAAEAAWEEHCDSPETLAAVAEWMAPTAHLIPPPPSPPEPVDDPLPSSPAPGGIFTAIRRRLSR